MSGNPYDYYNDPSLYAGQNYPSYAMQSSPPPPPVLSQDAIRKVVLQHPKAKQKDHTQAWIIGGLTALGVGAIAIWQRKALSHAWESVFKHEKPSVDIPAPSSSTKQVEETIEEEVTKKARKPRSSGSSGSSPKPNPDPPSKPEPVPTPPEPPQPDPIRRPEPPRTPEPTTPSKPSRSSTKSAPPPKASEELLPEVKKLVNDYNRNRQKFYEDNPGINISINTYPGNKIQRPLVSESNNGLLYKIDDTDFVFLGTDVRKSFVLGEEIQHLFEVLNPNNVDANTMCISRVLKPARVNSEGNLIEKGILEVD